MSWSIASDIAERIRDLREYLGDGEDSPMLQEEMGRRAGVRASQVSQWERGAQRPSRSRLERWAEREGWPVSIFQDGGPLPSEYLDRAQERAPEPEAGPPAGDPDELLARFYEVLAEASRAGRPCPPELATLIQRMHHLARGHGEPTSSAGRAGASPSSGDAADVPGW